MNDQLDHLLYYPFNPIILSIVHIVVILSIPSKKNPQHPQTISSYTFTSAANERSNHIIVLKYPTIKTTL